MYLPISLPPSPLLATCSGFLSGLLGFSEEVFYGVGQDNGKTGGYTPNDFLGFLILVMACSRERLA